MIAIAQERPIFENEEWLVTQDGLEHKDTGYFIERASLGQRRADGLWSWPLHMAEKSWCAMTPFAEAFSCAAATYDLESGADLAQTFKVARCEVAPWPQAPGPAVPGPSSALPRPLRKAGANPIYWEPEMPVNPLNGQAFDEPAGESRDDGRPRRSAAPRALPVPPRPARPAMVRAALPWRAPRRLRKSGTKLVRLIQAAWNVR